MHSACLRRCCCTRHLAIASWPTAAVSGPCRTHSSAVLVHDYLHNFSSSCRQGSSSSDRDRVSSDAWHCSAGSSGSSSSNSSSSHSHALSSNSSSRPNSSAQPTHHRLGTPLCSTTAASNTASMAIATSSSSSSSTSRRTHAGGAAAVSADQHSNPTTTTSATSSSSSSSGKLSPRPPPDGSEISSVGNAYIKHCIKLRDSGRYRQTHRRLLVAGSTLLSELADASPNGLEAVTVFLKPSTALPARLTSSNVIAVTDAVMKKLTGLEETGGVQIAAELPMPPLVDLLQQQQQHHQQQHQQQHQLEEAAQLGPQEQQQQQPVRLQRLLVLEAVQDPGNLGTLLRCAAAFGWDAVWLLPGCCDPFNDKALRASRGAGFKVPLAAGTLQQLLEVVEGRDMLLLAAEPDPEAGSDPSLSTAAADAADADASSNKTTSSSRPSSDSSSSSSKASEEGTPVDSLSGISNQPVALVLGSEGSGLSAEVLAAAKPLAVPMVGDMESLNVGVAGSILMFCLSEGWPQLTARLQQLQLVR